MISDANMKGTDDRVGLSTVIDAHPRFWCEFVLWLLSANRVTTAPKRAYFVGAVPESLAEFAERHGCDVRRVETLIPQSPHCNKIIPFLDSDGFANQFLTDADVFLLSDITQFLDPSSIRLPPNSHGMPPLEFFETVFAAAGLSPPEPGLAVFNHLGGPRETCSGNINAGLIAIPSGLRDFAFAWEEQARWLADNVQLLGQFAVHVDQVSFVLAVEKTKVPFRFLPPQTNCIPQMMPEIKTPLALHLSSAHVAQFPTFFNGDGTLNIANINPHLEEVLTAFNTLVTQAREEIAAIPEAAEFAQNLLNPSYQR